MANDRSGFEFVGGPALEDALVERHEKHGQFIDGVFSDAAILAFFKRWLLDRVYARLRDGTEVVG